MMPRPRAFRRRAAGAVRRLAVVAAAVTLVHLPLAAQAPLQSEGLASLVVAGHPWGTLVGITLIVPHGSADDPPGRAGTAWLTGAGMRQTIEDRLGQDLVSATVEVDRTQTLFQTLVVPGDWHGALRTLLEAVFSGSPAATTIELERGSLTEAFLFERNAPVRDFQDAFYALLAGADSSWSRNPRGSLQSIQTVTVDDILSYHRAFYDRDEAVAAVVGAVEGLVEVQVYGAGASGLTGSILRAVLSSNEPAPWGSGQRVQIARDVTSTWIGVAFPIPRAVPRTTAELIEMRVREQLNPDPPDPGLYGSLVRLEMLPSGPALLIETATLPEARERWEAKIVEAVGGLGTAHREPGFFRWHRRRFRSVRLVGEGDPESEGRRLAADLLRDGFTRDLAADIAGLGPFSLSEAVDSLGEPRILVYGPD